MDKQEKLKILKKKFEVDPNISYFDRDKIFNNLTKKDLASIGVKKEIHEAPRDGRYTLHHYLKEDVNFFNTISFQFRGTTEAAYEHLKEKLGDTWNKDFTGEWGNVKVIIENQEHGYNHYQIIHNGKVSKDSWDDDWNGFRYKGSYERSYVLEDLIHPLYSILLYENIIEPHPMSISMRESLLDKQSRGHYKGYHPKEYWEEK